MTSDETKNYIDQRLHELGLGLQLDDGGYEKIHRFTNGTESGLNQLCFKLVSLTSENGDHQVTTERVTKAIDELARIDEMMKRAGKSDVRQANDDLERTSIDQLAAVLEANAAVASAAAEAYAPPKPVLRTGGRAGAKRAAAPERRPKILVVNEAQTTRALIVNALASDFDCIETTDADDAWRRLVHQTDIALVITDVRAHDRAQYDLIGRIRSAAAPGHLIGIPIIAMAMTEDGNAKQRALVAGANDVIAMSTSTGELKTRVTARYKASRVAPQYGTPANKTVSAERPPERKNGAAPAGARTVAPRAKPAASTLNPASLEGVRRPFLNSTDAAQRAPARPRPLLGWLYQVSSTTTVTLSATVLVVVLLAVIMYVNRMPDSGSVATAPVSTGKIAEAPRTPPAETEPSSTAGASASTDAASSTTPKATAPTTPAPTQPSEATVGAERTADDTGARSAPEATRERTAGATTARPDMRTRQQQLESTAPAAGARAEPTPEPAPAPTPSAAPSAPETASPETVARQAETDSPAAKPAPERLTRDDLSALLKRFTFVYEAGDIEQFMNLFAVNARTNDRMNRDGIRQDYESLFRTTDLRQFKLSHINWEVDSNEAHGWGNFEVTVRRAGDQELHNYSGSLTLYVERIDGRARIVRLYHGQRRAGS